MSTKEKDLHDKVKRWIYASFSQSFFYKSNDRSTAGIPDVLACCGGRFVGIEIKLNHVLTPLQRATLIKIKRSGGLGLVWKKELVGDIDSFDMDTQSFTGEHYCFKDKQLKEMM